MPDVTASPTGPTPVTQSEIEKAVAMANGGTQGGQQAPAPAGGTQTTTADNSASAKPTTAQQQAKPAAEDPKPLDDDDPLPTDEKAMLGPMTMKSFMKRVSSMSRANLRKWFGTDDVEAIVAERKELEQLRKDKAEAEKAKLSETDRLKLEKQEAEKKAEEATQKANERVQRAVAREVETDLKSFVKEYVDREDVDDFLDKMAKAAANKDNGIDSTKKLKKWALDYIEKHPKWKKGGGSAKPETKKDAKPAEAKPEPRKVPLTNGARRVTDHKPVPTKDGDAPVLGKLSKQELFERTGLKL